MRSPLIVGAVALALLGGVAACGSPNVSDRPDSIRIGVSPDQLAADYDVTTRPLYSLDSKAVFDSLFQASADSTFSYEPNAATGYELSDDWKTLTITLRDDVVFTDGEALTAEGLATYLETMSTDDTWWFKAAWDDQAPTVTATDEFTLELTSEKPMSLSVNGFATGVLVVLPLASPAALADRETPELEPVGSGPYVVDSVTPGVSARLVKNADYWNADAYPFEEVELTVFEDDVAALNALKAGQIDATRLSIPLADEAENDGFRLDEGAGRITVMYVADREGTVVPAVADKRVRQAMALAFDRAAINESLNLGYGDVTSQPFQPGRPEFVPDGDARYGYDPESARELLAEAGYADGFDLVIPSTPFLGISVWQPVVQQYLGDIGIRVTFDEFADTGAYFTEARSQKYAVLMYSEVREQIVPIFLPKGSIFDVFGIDDPAFEDRWSVMQTGPTEDADAAAAELGEYVLDQAYLVPFAAAHYVWASAEGYSVQVGLSGNNVRVIDFQPAD